MHRPLLVYKMPSLVVIDGIPVTEEEQMKASLYYMQQEVGCQRARSFLVPHDLS